MIYLNDVEKYKVSMLRYFSTPNASFSSPTKYHKPQIPTQESVINNDLSSDSKVNRVSLQVILLGRGAGGIEY